MISTSRTSIEIDYGNSIIKNWTNIKAIAGGTWHIVGLKEDGTVVATGFNGYR